MVPSCFVWLSGIHPNIYLVICRLIYLVLWCYPIWLSKFIKLSDGNLQCKFIRTFDLVNILPLILFNDDSDYLTVSELQSILLSTEMNQGDFMLCRSLSLAPAIKIWHIFCPNSKKTLPAIFLPSVRPHQWIWHSQQSDESGFDLPNASVWSPFLRTELLSLLWFDLMIIKWHIRLFYPLYSTTRMTTPNTDHMGK